VFPSSGLKWIEMDLKRSFSEVVDWIKQAYDGVPWGSGHLMNMAVNYRVP
jgi:hypothetical protein